MRRLGSIFLLGVAACGPPPSGTLYARISADSALAAPFTTEDGWTLSFTHVVVAVGGFTVRGMNASAFTAETGKAKVLDFAEATRVDLDTNAAAAPRTYHTVSLTLARSAAAENVNVAADLVTRAGNRTLYVEGTATKQSTTRRFELGTTASLTYDGCMPPVVLDAAGSATVDFRVHAQRLFFDDAGKLRFEAWGLADAAPADGLVVNTEAAAVQTAALPMDQYGATSGSLLTVLEKRALSVVGLGDSGSCTGH